MLAKRVCQKKQQHCDINEIAPKCKNKLKHQLQEIVQALYEKTCMAIRSPLSVFIIFCCYLSKGFPGIQGPPGPPGTLGCNGTDVRKCIVVHCNFCVHYCHKRPLPDYYKMSRHCIHFREKKDNLGAQGP